MSENGTIMVQLVVFYIFTARFEDTIRPGAQFHGMKILVQIMKSQLSITWTEAGVSAAVADETGLCQSRLALFTSCYLYNPCN